MALSVHSTVKEEIVMGNRATLDYELDPLTARDAERSRAWRTVFPAQKQRKEPRFPFCFQIQVRGADFNLHRFEEHTNTADISKSGCRFSLQTRVARGSFLSISVQHEDGSFRADESALYSVVWCQPHSEGYQVGVELVDGPNLWNISFPDFSIGGW